MIDDNKIEELVYTNPLSFMGIKDAIGRVNEYLPYSVGIEVNCSRRDTYNMRAFEVIPDIMEVKSCNGEERFRIPNGLKGLICLYHIARELKVECEFNPMSGLHYHVDLRSDNSFDLIQRHIRDHEEKIEPILKELDTWEYDGTYNNRGFAGTSYAGSWIRFNHSHSTLEFRIGNMTFDYAIIVKRIIHINKIVRELKESIGITERTYESVDWKKILDYRKSLSTDSRIKQFNSLADKFQKEYEELDKPKEPEEQIIVRKRINRIE